MKSPLLVGPLVEFDVVASTQDEAVRLLKSGSSAGILFARHQTAGRGRFHRVWESCETGSLTVSFVFELEVGHNQPWLYGMAIACAVAMAFDLRLQWPNDLVWNGKKIGGILTEVTTIESGQRFAIIGLGLNLNGSGVPSEFRDRASSIEESCDRQYTPSEALSLILQLIEKVPHPDSWHVLKELWAKLDTSPGKLYRCPEGRVCIAKEIGEQGELIGDFGGQIEVVYAADAFIGGSAL